MIYEVFSLVSEEGEKKYDEVLQEALFARRRGLAEHKIRANPGDISSDVEPVMDMLFAYPHSEEIRERACICCPLLSHGF